MLKCNRILLIELTVCIRDFDKLRMFDFGFEQLQEMTEQPPKLLFMLKGVKVTQTSCQVLVKRFCQNP